MASTLAGGILQILVFLGKIACFMVLFVWIRWMVPRFRYDQLMDLGWKRFASPCPGQHHHHRHHPLDATSVRRLTMIIKRTPLKWHEKLYIPTLINGFKVTLSHFFFKKKVTMQYPEEKWTVPEGYRGAPYLVKDSKERTKCVRANFANLSVRRRPSASLLQAPR